MAVADKREFLVVISGKESVSPAAGKAEDALGDLGDQARKTERDFDGLDRKMREHADTIAHLRSEIAKTGDTKLFGELGRQEKAFGKLEGLKKSLIGSAADAAPEMAVSLSSRLGPLLARMPLSGPMGIALVAAAAAAAAPVGAVIAGAITGGVGIGGVVGGFLAAKNDSRVKAATASLAAEIGGQLEGAAKPLVPAIVSAFDEAGDELSKLQGALRSIFRNSAVNFAPLVEGAVGAVSKIVTGFEKLNAVSGPTIRAIAAGLEDFGGELGHVFESLSDNGAEAADAIRNLFIVINGGVRIVGGTVNALTELYGWMRKVTAARQGDTGTLARYVAAEIETKNALDGTANSLQGVSLGAIAAAAAINSYTASQRSSVDVALDAAEANLRYKESVVRAGEAVDGKKKVSIEEERALLGLIRATNDATVATDGSGVSAGEAAKKFATNRDKVVALAEKMGYSREEARKLADQLLKIPSVKPTVTLNEKAAKAQARNIRKAITDIKGKTVYINIIQNPNFGAGDNDQGALHGPSRNAAGGPVKAGEISWVGEQGKELLVMPRDGYVLNNRDSAMLAAGGGMSPVAATGMRQSGQPVVIQIAPGRFSGLERMFLSWLKEAIGNAGGNTVALGY